MSEKMMLSRLPPIDDASKSRPASGGMSGPCYTLTGSPVKHQLLSPAVMKPLQDTNAGTVETWPAHASTRGSNGPSLHLSHNRQSVVGDDSGSAAVQLTPKPKFLEQLEVFLQKELHCLGVTTVEPSDVRLQAYREVFDYLIESFKTYKPMLASIKNEYEMMLAHQRDEIQRLLPLQEMLVTVAEQCEQRIMSIREEEKQEMKDLKVKNHQLYETVDDLRNEHVSLKEQVKKLEDELASQYLRYRDEFDARKLLIADINDLRRQNEELLAAKNITRTQDVNKEDPVMLRIALRKAREDEMDASRRLNEMIANYGDVVPRRDFEQLQKQNEMLEETLKTLKLDFSSLKSEHDTLLEVHKQVLQQRDDCYVESETLRQASTPRPRWERCGEVVTGGAEFWTQATEGKTSDEIVDMLLAEIQDGGSGRARGRMDYFEGLGVGDDVPKYLQHSGSVRNRHLNKRDCALLIYDIWHEKRRHDAQKAGGRREKMSEYLHKYLRQTFGLEQMAVEWAYSLHDAAPRFTSDPQIALFWSVLIDEADEERYHSHLQTIERLASALKTAVDQKNASGTLLQEEFAAVLMRCFSLKHSESVERLVQAAVTELNVSSDDPLLYENLFTEDNEGHTGPFLEELRKQSEQEHQQYVRDVFDALDGKSPVDEHDVRQAFRGADPSVVSTDVERYMDWLMADRDKPGHRLTSCDAAVLLARLRGCNMRRAGHRP